MYLYVSFEVGTSRKAIENELYELYHKGYDVISHAEGNGVTSFVLQKMRD